MYKEDGTLSGRSERIIAGTLLYLLDPELSSFVTGTVIPIDGGFSSFCGVYYLKIQITLLQQSALGVFFSLNPNLRQKETQMLQKEEGASELFHYELVSVICCLLLNNAD